VRGPGGSLSPPASTFSSGMVFAGGSFGDSSQNSSVVLSLGGSLEVAWGIQAMDSSVKTVTRRVR